MTSTISAQGRLDFLRNVQAVLEDGQFVSTYKYALLIALADIAVETDSDGCYALTVPIITIADKFIEYYWQQSALFPGMQGPGVLHQNNGAQAAIVKALAEERHVFATLAKLRADPMTYRRLRIQVARTIREMPLFKLQNVGGRPREFLYRHALHDGAIQLEEGVADCLRTFYALVTGLARDRWAAMVRRLPQNRTLIGPGQDLESFLFWASREEVARFAEPLADLQHGACLYCQRALHAEDLHVDHFIPWSLHRLDAVPNLVASHASCNLSKSDYLAAEEHLAAWCTRNRVHPTRLQSVASQPGEDRTELCLQVARWAYGRAIELGQDAWLRGRTLVPLAATATQLLDVRFRLAAEPRDP